MSKKKKTQKNKSKPTEKKSNPTYDILRITWEDHWTGNKQWFPVEEEINTDPYICVSVGIKVRETDKIIMMAQNMGHNETASDTITIIKKCITKSEKLGEVEYGSK